ncbi:30S ribosomal protein S6e [Candidatus Woesearchaeota archaeon]|nr:30S ribosomal protein S6e [Candidatus Woesearchaeota archaeon]
MALKLVISDPKSGFSIQREAAEDAAKGFMGLKIGDTVKGELFDLHGYEFMLTGGSDFCGFPMRKDVPGIGRKKILAYEGVGIKKLKKGILQRKTVCGNTVHAKISQVNLKVTKHGSEDIFAEAGKKKEDGAKNEGKAEEKKAGS